MARINIVNADNKIESNPRRAYFKLKNTGGPKGDTGAQGPQGPKGDTGAQGPAGLSASVTVGSTTTLAPGASATVTNSGDTRNAVLNFGIPTGAQGPQGVQGPKGDTGPEGAKGAKGDTGAAATVAVANTNTGAPGTNASVENVGDEHNAVLNFTIPRGDKGETGAQGPQGEQGPAGQDFTPTVVTALPETGENGVLYMTEKAHTTQTATGNPITVTITDGAGKMEAFQLDGDTFQQSYTGKNLFNAQGDYVVGQINGNTGGITEDSTGTTVTTGIGSIKVVNSHPSSNFRGYVSSKIVLQAGSYTLSFTRAETTGHYVAVFTFDSNDNFLGRIITLSGQATSGNGDISDQVAYVRIVFETNTHGTTVTFNDIQLEAGSTATAYEPYVGGQPSPNPDYPQPVQTVTGEQTVTINGQAFQIDLGTIELCKLGDAQDSIYYDGSAWMIEKQMLKFTPDGSENWFRSGGTTQTHFVSALSIVSLKTSFAQRADAKSTHFGYMVSTGPIGQSPGFALYNTSGALTSNIAFSLPVTTANDIDAAKEWLATNRPSFYISLDSTGVTTTTITDANLIAQLEAIRTALLQNGANTITNTATSPNLAGDMEIGYYGYTPSSQYDKWLWLDVGAAGAHYEQI